MNKNSRAVWVAVFVVLIAPFALLSSWLVVFSENRIDGGLSLPEVPETIPVMSTLFDPKTAVQVSFTWGDPSPVAYYGNEGVVTRVYVKVGDKPKSGDLVMQIDGIDRKLLRGKIPLYRAVDRFASPEEIESVNFFLKALNYPAGAQDLWTDQSKLGTEQYARDLGLVDRVSSFDPAWIVWAPETSSSVATIDLHQGFFSPSSGTPIMTYDPSLVDVVIAGGGTVEGANGFLELAGATLALDKDGQLDPSAYGSVEDVINSKEDEMNGVVSSGSPVDAYSLPPSAVMSDSRGRTCVLITGGKTGETKKSSASQQTLRWRTQRVVVLGGAPGTTSVKADFSTGSVIINPLEVTKNLECATS